MNPVQASAKGPLAGLRVLDVTRVLSGPWAGQMLGDLGAEVIKIEQPARGDDFRHSPPHMKDRDGQVLPLESSLYLSTNRNKKSVTLNLSSDEGRALLRRLADQCDILVENSRAGTMQRRGLGYEALAASNPGLIYCSISGFGQSGPYAAKAGYDSTFQAMSGMMSYTGHPDGTPCEGPLRTGPSLCDVNAGMYAVVAVLAALHHRHETGRGQFIDLGMLDATFAMVSHYAMGSLVAGVDAPRAGNGSPFAAPVGRFPCRDGQIMITGGTDPQFVKLCGVLGCPEFLADPRFSSREGRIKNRAAIDVLIAERTRLRDSAELRCELERAGLSSAPIYDTTQACEDPQIRHRRMLREVPHPLAGTMKTVANPINYSETRLERYDAPPLLGQHTDEVLRELLGVEVEEAARLRASGIV